jgi:hypothetical protein
MSSKEVLVRVEGNVSFDISFEIYVDKDEYEEMLEMSETELFETYIADELDTPDVDVVIDLIFDEEEIDNED